MGIVIEKKEYPLVEPGIYPAIVEDIQEATGQFGPQLKWKFTLLDKDADEERHVWAWCSQTLSPKSKLTAWTMALLGSVPAALDVDDLLHQKCQIALVVVEGKDGVLVNKVDGVYPWRAPKAAARPVAQAEPANPPAPAPAAALAKDEEDETAAAWAALGKR